jgi:site-specific recombinase XerD
MDRLPADPNSDPKVIFPDQWHRQTATPVPELPTPATSAGQALPNSPEETVPFSDEDSAQVTNTGEEMVTFTGKNHLPTVSPSPPLVPERSDFLEGDAPAASKVEAFLARALEATGSNANITAGALVPWICDALLSNHSVKAYGRDLMDFLRHMQAQGVKDLDVTADHVKLYKRALVEAGRTPATVARRLSVLRGTYKQLAAKGLVSWETAQDIAAIKAPGVQKNATPSLTQKQAIDLLRAIPTDTLQGMRDLALMSVFFLTGCRVSAVVAACVGHLETDGVEHYLNVTEKRNKKRRKLLLDAARPLLAYVAQAGIAADKEGPLFRPLTPKGSGFERRHLDRKTPWRLVKKYCKAAGIDPDRLGQRGIGIHSLRKTAINDAIRNGAQMHEVREFAGHSDIRTTELYFVRKEEDAEVAARCIHIRLTGRKGEETPSA